MTQSTQCDSEGPRGEGTTMEAMSLSLFQRGGPVAFNWYVERSWQIPRPDNAGRSSHPWDGFSSRLPSRWPCQLSTDTT